MIEGILTPKENKDVYNRELLYPIVVTLKSTEGQSSSNYGHFFTCDSSYSIAEIIIVTSTAGTGSIQIEKLTGSQATNSGKKILLNDYNLNATANVPNYPQLINSDAILLSRGDRLGLRVITSPATIQNLSITIYLSKK